MMNRKNSTTIATIDNIVINNPLEYACGIYEHSTFFSNLWTSVEESLQLLYIIFLLFSFSLHSPRVKLICFV